MFGVGDGFAQAKHMKDTEHGLPNSRRSIEVTPVADGSLGG